MCLRACAHGSLSRRAYILAKLKYLALDLLNKRMLPDDSTFVYSRDGVETSVNIHAIHIALQSQGNDWQVDRSHDTIQNKCNRTGSEQ